VRQAPDIPRALWFSRGSRIRITLGAICAAGMRRCILYGCLTSELSVDGFFLLPLREKVARTKSATDEGSVRVEMPLTRLASLGTLSRKGRG
jgi:hypothetical protein